MDHTYYLSILILIIVIISALSIVFHTVINGISPMPSAWRARSVVLNAAKELPAPRNIVDLGSGWGTLCFGAAKMFPNASITGFENSPVPFLYCSIIRRVLRKRNVHFSRRNFFKEDLSSFDLIFCYLHTSTMKKLKPKLRNELKPGALVISNTFALREWNPEKTIEIGDMYLSKVYVYKA